MSALTKFSITGSPVAAGLAEFAELPCVAGVSVPARLREFCAAAVGTSEVAVIDSAHASAIERDSDNPPARREVRLLVMSTTEIQEGPVSVSPPQQRNQARKLRLYARVGPRHGLCPASEA